MPRMSNGLRTSDRVLRSRTPRTLADDERSNVSRRGLQLAVTAPPTINAQSPIGSIDFLRFPWEVRRMIYECNVELAVAFCKNCQRVTEDKLVYTISRPRKNYQPALSMTSNAIREEVLDVFYRSATFDIRIPHFDPVELIDWLEAIGHRASQLRKVYLHFHTSCCDHVTRPDLADLLDARRAMPMCNLSFHGDNIHATCMAEIFRFIDREVAAGLTDREIRRKWRGIKGDFLESGIEHASCDGLGPSMCGIACGDDLDDVSCIDETISCRDEFGPLPFQAKPSYYCEGDTCVYFATKRTKQLRNLDLVQLYEVRADSYLDSIGA